MDLRGSNIDHTRGNEQQIIRPSTKLQGKVAFAQFILSIRSCNITHIEGYNCIIRTSLFEREETIDFIDMATLALDFLDLDSNLTKLPADQLETSVEHNFALPLVESVSIFASSLYKLHPPLILYSPSQRILFSLL